ncbi:helix-turn-helix domain-containing protein [Taibaiella koreensis]|uniref:helix-turn-helix domain-containing protein n=1 Tax=Taibaiella koreensis TaxID=1268548 RepID=UPI000E59CC4E|nr:helix-turn-helix transcriptional regulator [Taibaiella koreensis]
MNLTQKFSKKLKILREINNYTQEYVARVLDISQNAYSLIEKGTTKITLDRIEVLAELYKTTPSELVNINDNFYTNPTAIGEAQHSNIPPNLSSFEKRMYEQTISRLEIDIEKLYNLINQLATNISKPEQA